jgi:hypothetical protein
MAVGGRYSIKIDSSLGIVRAWLYGFKVGDAVLRGAHRELLDSAIVPVIRDGGNIKVMGLASTTASLVFDQQLGQRRMHAVVNYLRLHCGNKFAVSRQVSYGKVMALLFGEEHLAGGTADHVESDLWRAVVINAWSRSVPPPPPIGIDVPFKNSTWADSVSKAIDTVNMALGFLDFIADIFELTRVAEVSGPAGLVAGIIQSILAMPLTWAAADALANTNGQIQGAADAIQDMADQYSKGSLDRTGLSKWPAVVVPTIHAPENPQPTVYQSAWRSGQLTGLKNAVKAVLDLEQHPKPFMMANGRHVRITGRVWLRAISRAFGDNAGVKVVVIPANEELKKRGRPPFPTH